jgi:hypothetical protein
MAGTLARVHPSRTWALVTIQPSAFTKKPVPELEGFDCECAKPADTTDARIPNETKHYAA